MSKTCDRCGKELAKRDRTTICLECEVALADEVKEQLEAENAALRTNAMILEEIIKKGGDPADKEKIVLLAMNNAELRAELRKRYQGCRNCPVQHSKKLYEKRLIQLEETEGKNIGLRAQLAAAIEDIKRMDRYIAKSDDPYAALCEVCKYKPQNGRKCKRCDVHDNAGFEWRGDQEGEQDRKSVV